jgi:hypothetical protein
VEDVGDFGAGEGAVGGFGFGEEDGESVVVG